MAEWFTWRGWTREASSSHSVANAHFLNQDGIFSVIKPIRREMLAAHGP